MKTSFPSSAEPVADAAEFAASWREWHDALDEGRRDPHGVLAFTGLVWLTPEAQRIPGVPGVYRVATGDAVVEAVAADGLFLADQEIDGPLVLGGAGPHLLTFDGGEIEIARRGDHVIARPRLEDSPFLAAFAGTDAWPADAAWRVPARFEAWETARAVTVDAVTGRFEHELAAVGTLHVEIAGTSYALTAFAGFTPGTVRLPFRDATSGTDSYGAGRTVTVEIDRDDVTVDFTRATNLPCAYSDFGTCPLPPAGNRITVPVTAGEKTPTLRLTAHADGRAVVIDTTRKDHP
ncbi:DUF1684 domain-containing protein [Microbacterium protaetiae]|uniref:DUF1684 domain-containing protein n=1 Tax=Microbacterium protaetiae TaxID=2509458 RepID=UPI0013EE2F8F|nr:DUF1684 domain-containing protein [Microbacterium protaetiae]